MRSPAISSIPPYACGGTSNQGGVTNAIRSRRWPCGSVRRLSPFTAPPGSGFGRWRLYQLDIGRQAVDFDAVLCGPDRDPAARERQPVDPDFTQFPGQFRSDSELVAGNARLEPQQRPEQMQRGRGRPGLWGAGGGVGQGLRILSPVETAEQ